MPPVLVGDFPEVWVPQAQSRKEEKTHERPELVTDDGTLLNLRRAAEPPEDPTLESQLVRAERSQRKIADFELGTTNCLVRLDEEKFSSMRYRLRSDTLKIISDLMRWGELRGQIRDAYKELEEHCHEVVAALGDAGGLTTSDPLLASTVDLRNILDICLAENATPEDVELHLPRVRQITEQLLLNFNTACEPRLAVQRAACSCELCNFHGSDEQKLPPDPSFGSIVSSGWHVYLV
ncbi:hypothetical protein ONZ45_g7766 [Pleurotus djamor]|nr:hypothetical protein ONZ45_g7766 [Pleurotus djamor]